MRRTLWPSSSVGLKLAINPSSLRMRAISDFSLEEGISTFWCRERIALRIRVSMSATGSVNLIVCFSSTARYLWSQPENCGGSILSLPGRLRNPRNLTPQRQPAETQAANAELAEERARTSANLAAVVLARGELGFLRVL